MKQTLKQGRVLVVDDEKNIVIVLCAILEKRGYQAIGFTNAKQALVALRENFFDVAITDLFMPEIDGMEFLRQAKHLKENLPVIVITAFGAVETAVDAIKSGAFDYVTKPFEQSEICAVVDKAVNTRRLSQLEVIPGGMALVASASLSHDSPPRSPILHGISRGVVAVEALVAKVANSPSSILLFGEPGTGKELWVEEIHHRSARAEEVLLKINCAALPDTALEADLFGTESRPGALQIAKEGTLFLDEVSEMSISIQIRLMNFLEESQQSGARILSASYKNLNEEVSRGNFREDLLYKLNIVQLELPPLRDRIDDFKEILLYYLERISKKLSRTNYTISDDAVEELKKFHWPGNYRQLENVLERIVLLLDATTIITIDDIPNEIKVEAMMQSNLGADSFRKIIKSKIQDLERELIEAALRKTNDNITHAAAHLGISRKGLQIKLKELGIHNG